MRITGKIINSTTLLLSNYTVTISPRSVTIDLTQPLVILYGGQKAQSADTFTAQHASVTIQKL